MKAALPGMVMPVQSAASHSCTHLRSKAARLEVDMSEHSSHSDEQTAHQLDIGSYLRLEAALLGIVIPTRGVMARGTLRRLPELLSLL